MLTAEDNDRLCRISSDRPMGAVLRHYWIPALLSNEVEAGGAPRLVRLLNEEVLAFRNTEGIVGVIAPGCPHRGTSLALARNEDCGLTCLYHGWRIGVDGTILEAPTVNPGGPFTARVSHRAYPSVEGGGFIWVYLGDDDPPDPPTFPWMILPERHVHIIKCLENANWVQALEGSLDSAHTNYLHVDNVVPSDATTSTDYADKVTIRRVSDDGRPKIEVEDAPYGFRYAAIRRPLRHADQLKYVRVTLFVAPFYALNAQPPGWGQCQIFVPSDDFTTFMYNVRWIQPSLGEISERERAQIEIHFGARLGIDLDAGFAKAGNSSNTWLQDRDAMRRGELKNGLRGVLLQDHSVQESMGPIVDRSKEHLGPTDLAIIRMRRLMLEAATAVESGDKPLGARDGASFVALRAEEGLVPIGSDWQEVDEIASRELAKRR
jgi:phthalate 4,5-dioxygenase oxygenase subunit